MSLRTIMFDTQTGLWWETTPEEVATSGGNLRQLLRCFATSDVLIAARVDWQSTTWLHNQWNMRGTPKHSGRRDIGLIPRESIRVSALVSTQADPHIIAWELPWSNIRPSREYLDECMNALGVTREQEGARSFRPY